MIRYGLFMGPGDLGLEKEQQRSDWRRGSNLASQTCIHYNFANLTPNTTYLEYKSSKKPHRMLHEWNIGILEPDRPSLRSCRPRWTSIEGSLNKNWTLVLVGSPMGQ
jgi:hypothetical protein